MKKNEVEYALDGFGRIFEMRRMVMVPVGRMPQILAAKRRAFSRRHPRRQYPPSLWPKLKGGK